MMFRQLHWLGINFKVAYNTVVIAVKNKSCRFLSSSQTNHDGKPRKIPAFNFLRFYLPTDYFESESTGMKPCKFAGKIHIVKDEEDEQRLVQDGVVSEDFERQKALGMDMEYSQNHSPPPSQRVCLIQVSSKENAVLWMCSQGNFRNRLPPYLLSLISGDVWKVGHGLCHDVVELQKNYGECTNNIVDTHTWAREMDCFPLNLKAMCAIFLHQHLTKRIQQSNWSKNVLTEEQLIYAATDAWASLRVYEEMIRAAELLSIPLSLPLKSTLDVILSRNRFKKILSRNRRGRQRGKQRI